MHELHIQDRNSYIAGSGRIWFGSFPGTKFVHWILFVFNERFLLLLEILNLSLLLCNNNRKTIKNVFLCGISFSIFCRFSL